MIRDADSTSHATQQTETMPLPALGVRGALGGILMGLANLVPGISGGTMLLAAGVYPAFIGAIAELTTLRFRIAFRRSSPLPARQPSRSCCSPDS